MVGRLRVRGGLPLIFCHHVGHIAAGGAHAIPNLLEREAEAAPAVAVGLVEIFPAWVVIPLRGGEVLMELLQSRDVGWVDALSVISS